MLWHENHGGKHKSKGTELSAGKRIRTFGKFNEEIYSTIRRFVVVRQMSGHCLCM